MEWCILKGGFTMATQEERLETLENGFKQFRTETIKAYQNVAVELVMIKGLALDSVERLKNVGRRFDSVESGLSEMRRDVSMIELRLNSFEQSVDSRFAVQDKRFDSIDKRLEVHDKRFDSVDKRLDSMGQRLEAHDKRFDNIDKRLEAQDKRLDNIDQRLEAQDKRLDNIDQRLEAQDKHLDSIDKHLEMQDKRFDSMDQRLGAHDR